MVDQVQDEVGRLVMTGRIQQKAAPAEPGRVLDPNAGHVNFAVLFLFGAGQLPERDRAIIKPGLALGLYLYAVLVAGKAVALQAVRCGGRAGEADYAVSVSKAFLDFQVKPRRRLQEGLQLARGEQGLGVVRRDLDPGLVVKGKALGVGFDLGRIGNERQGRGGRRSRGHGRSSKDDQGGEGGKVQAE